MSHNVRRMMQRKVSKDHAYDQYKEQKLQEMRYRRMAVAQIKAETLVKNCLALRVPRWSRWVAMHIMPEWYGNFWLILTSSLPGRWDKAMTYDYHFPPTLVRLILLPYNIVGLILTMIFMWPVQWLRMRLWLLGHKVSYRMSSQKFAIHVVVRNFFLYPILDEMVEVEKIA